MRCFFNHFLSVLIFILISILISCKKDSPETSIINAPVTSNINVEDVKGDWKLKSEIFDGSEFMNAPTETNNGIITTSCGSEITYHNYSTFVGATLSLSTNGSFSCDDKYANNSLDLSSYDSCFLIYFQDTTVFNTSGSWHFDEAGEKFMTTWLYHISPGGAKLYTTDTFSIIGVTDTTMVVSSLGPNLLTLARWDYGIYTFVR
jgi:hypothetical protein